MCVYLDEKMAFHGGVLQLPREHNAARKFNTDAFLAVLNDSEKERRLHTRFLRQ